MERIPGEQTKKRKWPRATLAWTARACDLTFIFLLILLHYIDPSLDPIRTSISEYAIGAAGPIMVSAFVVLAIGSMGLAIGLYLSTPRTRETKTGFLLLLLSGFFILMAGVFVTDPVGRPLTPTGIVHASASLAAFLLVIVAMALWTRTIEADPRLKKHTRNSARLTFATALLLVIFLLASGFAAGLIQRAFVASVLLWHLYMTRIVFA